jgi:hypothetical protein
MVDSESKDDITTTTRSTEAANLYDTSRQNYIRVLDEFTKAQPQHTESVSKSPPIIWSNELQTRLCVMYAIFFI